MKHYKRSSPVTWYNTEQSHCTHIVGSPQCMWAIAVYTNKQTRNLLDRIISRAPDTVRSFDGWFAHFKHQFWHLPSCTVRGAFRNWKQPGLSLLWSQLPEWWVSISYQWPAPYTFPPFSLLLPQIGLIAYCQFSKHKRFLLVKPCLGEGLCMGNSYPSFKSAVSWVVGESSVWSDKLDNLLRTTPYCWL